MREYWETINCLSSEYQLYAYEVDPSAYAEDREFVESIRGNEAYQRAMRMNRLNTAGEERTWEECLKDAYLGVLGEKLIAKYLFVEFNQEANVVREAYTTYHEHVDIKINWNNKYPTTIEVRSSFAYGDMSRVVCDVFDHIGPYTTSYKSDETPQDFYLRGVLHEEYQNSFCYDTKHILYFAGGVPYRWLKESGTVKSMGKRGAQYLTIPLWQGMDVVEIISEIRSVGSAV